MSATVGVCFVIGSAFVLLAVWHSFDGDSAPRWIRWALPRSQR